MDDVALRRDLVRGGERRAGLVHVEDPHRALGVVEKLVVDRDERLQREAAARTRLEHLFDDGDGIERRIHQPRLGIREGRIVEDVRAERAGVDVSLLFLLERDDGHGVAEDGDLALEELRAHLVVVRDHVAVEGEKLPGVAVLGLLDDPGKTVGRQVADHARQFTARIHFRHLVVVFLHISPHELRVRCIMSSAVWSGVIDMRCG